MWISAGSFLGEERVCCWLEAQGGKKGGKYSRKSNKNINSLVELWLSVPVGPGSIHVSDFFFPVPFLSHDLMIAIYIVDRERAKVCERESRWVE